MASLLQPADPTDPNNTVSTSTSSGSSAGASPSINSAIIPTAPAAQAAPNPQQDTQQAINLNSGFNFQPLLDFVGNDGTAARNTINSTNSQFQSGLGTFNPFGTQDQTKLNSVLDGTDPNLTDGTSLLSRTSTPSPINNAAYDPLVSRYQTDAANTATPTGLSALLGTARPDLTPGEMNFDALTYGANPSYQTSSRNLVNDSNAVAGLAGTTTGNANTAVTQRGTDVNAFNTAAKGYVQNQLNGINDAINLNVGKNAVGDAGVSNELNNLRSGGQPLNGAAPNLSFDPTQSQFQPQDIKGQDDPNFDEKVDPLKFLLLNPGDVATRENTVTADLATRFNNANKLLNTSQQITPGSARKNANIGFDSNAFQAALNQANLDRAQADALWRLNHQPAPAPVAETPIPVPLFQAGIGADGSDSDSDGEGGDSTSAGGSSDDEGGNASGPSGESSDGGPGEGEGGSGGGSDGDGEFKGGFIKRFPQANVPVARKGYQQGGKVPDNAGPNIRDSVPTNVNNGEFVLRQPSVNVLGAQNLTALNAANNLPPDRQAALHAALSKLLMSSY